MFSSLQGRNLNILTTAADLRTLVTQQGRAMSPEVVTELHSDRSRGFVFVEMATPDDATTAISALDGRNVDGRALTVAIQTAVTMMSRAKQRIDIATQRCLGCGHPRKEHRDSGCTVPQCACVEYRPPSNDQSMDQKGVVTIAHRLASRMAAHNAQYPPTMNRSDVPPTGSPIALIRRIVASGVAHIRQYGQSACRAG